MTNKEKVQKIVDKLGPEYSIREDYSGRNMSGDTCLGIVGPDATDIQTVASRTKFGKGRVDNMGLNYIVYWPGRK